jgi:hypothetical protein
MDDGEKPLLYEWGNQFDFPIRGIGIGIMVVSAKACQTGFIECPREVNVFPTDKDF